jgi:ornithine cyclodeaminase/alanine dehydrogenase-like protein (mu-crystallin family)
MALFLNDAEVTSLLSTVECIDILDDLFMQEAEGKVENLARRRARLSRGVLMEMGGVVLGSGVAGVRFYGAGGKNLTTILNADGGAVEAVLETPTLSTMRTGAASGLATKYLAQPHASTVGIIGVGRQASYQLEAVCAVRPVKKVKAFSRTSEKREAWAKEMAAKLEVEVIPVDSAEEALHESRIVIAITNSSTPVFDGEAVEPGTHINAAGANSWQRREVDNTTIHRAALVVVDNFEQAKTECGELIHAAEQGVFRWSEAVELKHVVAGHFARPFDTAVTLFESQGLGIEDVACCAVVIRKARELGIGTELPF